MASHDIVAQRDYVPKLQDVPFEVDEDECTIKMVQLVKSNDPLVRSSALPLRLMVMALAQHVCFCFWLLTG